jgi:hypothetical protein
LTEPEVMQGCDPASTRCPQSRTHASEYVYDSAQDDRTTLCVERQQLGATLAQGRLKPTPTISRRSVECEDRAPTRTPTAEPVWSSAIPFVEAGARSGARILEPSSAGDKAKEKPPSASLLAESVPSARRALDPSASRQRPSHSHRSSVVPASTEQSTRGLRIAPALPATRPASQTGKQEPKPL